MPSKPCAWNPVITNQFCNGSNHCLPSRDSPRARPPPAKGRGTLACGPHSTPSPIIGPGRVHAPAPSSKASIQEALSWGPGCGPPPPQWAHVLPHCQAPSAYLALPLPPYALLPLRAALRLDGLASNPSSPLSTPQFPLHKWGSSKDPVGPD